MSDTPVAIVTAAGRGIGAAAARALAANGHRVALMSRSADAETLAGELDGLGTRGSVTEPSDLERLVKTTLDGYGRIDVVVTNTGHPARGDLLALTDDDWRAGMDLCLLATIRMARLVAPLMIDPPDGRAPGGVFINVSTAAALEPDPDFPVSCTMRAALAAYAKLFAGAHAAYDVRMNNVLPGFVDSYPTDEERLRKIPMQRYATVDEVGGTIAFLASRQAAYITGQNIRVDGGLTRSV
jgi:NAD(P)-dependent dehydrogenase (short-subunit alcohol dehydrogenase family)